MRFEPKSEKEIAEAGLLPAGEYDFEVFSAEETVSKAGNDMTALVLSVYDNDGNARRVRDWLVGTEKSIFKVYHFAKSVDLLAAYEKGDMPAEMMVGRVGRCKIVVKKSDGYPDQNGVSDYVEMKGGGKPVSKSKDIDLDDSIPF